MIMPMAEKVDPSTVELRASPPSVMRLSRRMIVVLAGAISAAILLATMWSLRPAGPRVEAARAEVYNVDRVARADVLERLPADYSKIPTPAVHPLGEPLPGDLGAAMLQAGVSVTPEEPFSELVASGRSMRDGETDEVVRSPLFFRLQGGDATRSRTSAGPATSGPNSGGLSSDQMTSLDALLGLAGTPGIGMTGVGSASANLARSDFGAVDAEHRNASSLELPISPYQVMAGTVIPAALVTGINSDLPGQVIATVTEDVRDTATGQHLLIPQGSRLIGRYDSDVAFGQRRVLLVWTRLILPDASSVALDRLPGIDPAGYAGLEDGVDWHWKRLAAGATLSTVLSVAAELATSRRDDDTLIAAGRDGVQDTMNRIGQAVTQRNLDIKPTLTVRPGYPLRVMVHKDLVVRPYPSLFVNRREQ